MEKQMVIWGAGGIGSALARLMIQNGWRVAVAGRHTAALQDTSAFLIETDLASPAAVQAASVEISQEMGPLDWWVYAAGDILSKPTASLSPEEWQRILNANLNGVFLTAHFSQSLLTSSAPLYILGAVNERMRLPGLSAYAAAKAGVEALGEVLRKELRRPVVIIRPGAVDTPLWAKVPFRLPAHSLKSTELAERLYEAYQGGFSEARMDL